MVILMIFSNNNVLLFFYFYIQRMDTTWQFQKSAVPRNLKQVTKGPPIDYRVGPIKCPDSVPYFNVYKRSCDLYNNRVARDLQNHIPESLVEKDDQNLINIYNERLTPADPDEDSEFWAEAPGVIFSKKYFHEVIPLSELPTNRFLNAIVRLSICLFLIFLLFTCNLYSIFIILFALIVTYIQKAFSPDTTGTKSTPDTTGTNENTEDFIGLPIFDGPKPTNSERVGTSNDPAQYDVYNTPTDFDDRLFKSVSENVGDYMQEANKVISWDPFCQKSMTKGGIEHVLYGNNVGRHLFY